MNMSDMFSCGPYVGIEKHSVDGPSHVSIEGMVNIIEQTFTAYRITLSFLKICYVKHA